MLKKRIIACLSVCEGLLVQSFGFSRHLPLGDAKIAAAFLDRWGIDEIILLDIRASQKERSIRMELVREVSKTCFVPLSAGGGIRTLDDAKQIFSSGADKIVLNTSALQNPELISEIARQFGEQSVVVSIDAKRANTGEFVVCSRSGHTTHSMHPAEWAKRASELGAGEIMLRTIERDGSRRGYDLALLSEVARSVTVPIIAAGGAGRPEHFAQALQLPGICAAAAGNYFQHSEHSVVALKSSLEKTLDIRIDTRARYSESVVDKRGRVSKKSDEMLRELRFVRLEKEII